MKQEQATVLSVDQLRVDYRNHSTLLPAVRSISLQVAAGGCTGIIGESGCGKSLTCQAILGLLEPDKWCVQAHEVLLNDQPIPIQDDRAMDAFRGSRIAMIPQNPMEALDPRLTIGTQFCEGTPRRLRKQRLAEAEALLQRMYIREPASVLRAYPFQLSGGMMQRILIAMAIAAKPQLILADEPTTALDATTQFEILTILQTLQRKDSIGILLVSHDLNVISQMADTICVMYAGEIVEYGPKTLVLNHPLHPYTCGLFRSRPAFSKAPLEAMQGRPPSLEELDRLPCAFADRCTFASDSCIRQPHPLWQWEPGHWCRCEKGDFSHEAAVGSTSRF